MTCRECQCRLLDPKPRAPGSVGGAQAFAFLTSSKMMLMMLVWGPYLRTTVAEKEMTVQRWGTQRVESCVQGALCTPKLVHAHRHLTAYFYMPIYNTEVFSFSKSLKLKGIGDNARSRRPMGVPHPQLTFLECPEGLGTVLGAMCILSFVFLM